MAPSPKKSTTRKPAKQDGVDPAHHTTHDYEKTGRPSRVDSVHFDLPNIAGKDSAPS